MGERTIGNIILLWKFLLYQNKPVHFRTLQKYLEQCMERNEFYFTIRAAMALALIDRTSGNKFAFGQKGVLRGINYTYVLNPSKDELIQMKELNNDIIIPRHFGCLIVPNLMRLPDSLLDKHVGFSFKGICQSIGDIANVFMQLEQLEMVKECLGEKFNGIKNRFETEETKITDDTYLFRRRINAHFVQYYSFVGSIQYAVPDDNYEITDTLKLLSQIEKPNKFLFNKDDSILTLKYCTIPFFVERLLALNSIMTNGNFPLNRQYAISESQLRLLNTVVFNNKLQITYE